MKHVQTKLFRNGGSWAVRIPAEWVAGAGDVELVERRPGVIEVKLVSRRALFEALAEDCKTDPLTPTDLPITARNPELDRYDIAQLLAERE